MIDGFIVIILVMLGCIGLGVLLGWVLWGNDMKYYKCLSEWYKQRLNYPEVKEVYLKREIGNVVKNCKRYDT